MEILKEDFEANLPLLHKAISECDFVAMDTELTGLNTPANNHRFPDSLSTRYSKVSASANDFLVIQLGICTFTWSDKLGAYEARPFNFPCFPSNDDEAKSGERFFMSQSSSLEFLLKNDFDFNKWIRHGIPYLTRREEQDYIVRKTQKEAEKAETNKNDIPLDDRNRSFVETTIAKIKDWLETTKGLHGDSLTIPANNAFFRRLVHQVIRTDFNGDLDSSSNAQERTMTLRRMTDKIRKEKEDAKIARPPKLNLRRVIDMIIESKKPMIGHNCLLDLMQITQQFLWQLPHELEDWKPPVVDAASTPAATKPAAAAASAASAAPATEKSSEKYHEAGYDAFITGMSYLRMAGYDTEDEFAKAAREYQQASDAQKRTDKANDEDEEVEDGEVEETEVEKKAILEKRKRVIMENPTQEFLEDEELQDYYNKMHVMRSDFPIMNLAGPDPEPEDRPLSYLLRNVHSSMQSSTLFQLFQEYNPFTFSWLDDSSVWIQLSKEPYEPRPLTLGRLGEDYVDPFCVGSDEKAVKGREVGIIPQAADIEVVAWKQWYDEREARERQQREVLKQQRELQAAQAQPIRKGPLKRPFRAGPGVNTPAGMTSAACLFFVLFYVLCFVIVRH
ncbi:MAG: ribonuclease H-like domain-containing protein [Linnemannia gamsii]|nr:MAG: ribonuclease H-like domain-containing protein [Linnemannia gamsii]